MEKLWNTEEIDDYQHYDNIFPNDLLPEIPDIASSPKKKPKSGTDSPKKPKEVPASSVEDNCKSIIIKCKTTAKIYQLSSKCNTGAAQRRAFSNLGNIIVIQAYEI